MALKVFNLPVHLVVAAIEAMFLTKAFPAYFPQQNAFSSAYIRLLAAHASFVALYFFFYLGLIYPYYVSPLRHFPTPSGTHSGFYSLGMRRQPPGAHFREWSADTDNDGVLLLRSPFHRNRLLLTNPRSLADVLVHNTYDFEKPKQIRGFLRHVLGDGLIVSEGEIHKFQRKHVMPAFSFRHIKDLYPMMWRKSLALNDALTKDIVKEGKELDVYSWSSRVTLDIIGIAGMGQEFHALNNNSSELVNLYEELLRPTTERFIFFLVSAFGPSKLIRMLPWKLNTIFYETADSLRRISRDIVHRKRELIKADADDNFDILSLLIKSNDFDDNALVDQLLTFLAAGHETTSSAFTWLTYLLATHPDIKQKIREEVRAALPKNPLNDPSIDLAKVLESLPWLNGACNETLRLYPTVPITIRIAVRDTYILNKPIPRNTDVIISPWAVNHNPKLWGEDADEFKPERWIDDGKPNNNGGAESNYSNLTFLHGSRSCIGQGFAKAELRCLAAAFIGAFDWEMTTKPEDVIAGGAITIKPKYGLHLKLKPLEGW